MIIEKLSNSIDIKKYLNEIGVDGGGVNILAKKAKTHLISIKNLHVGGANILKQDALSVGADLAVPRGTVLALTPEVDCLLIATTRQLEVLAKKELSQPFGLKTLAHKIQEFLSTKKSKTVQIMGVINANDDSFFSDSRLKNADAIVKIELMIDEGASIIDIGGVSSRPNAALVTPEEEFLRVKPIIDMIKDENLYEKVKFSIDSYTPKVIEHALNSGFKIVNDIRGLEDDEVCKLCSAYDATAIIMHMQGRPQSMQDQPEYANILTDVYDFLQERVLKAESFGIKDIIIDVGIGFGKTVEDNLILLKHLEHFKTITKPILIGASRKSMIDKIVPSKVENRLGGTLALHQEAIKNGAEILRVHDVAAHNQLVKITQAFQKI